MSQEKQDQEGATIGGKFFPFVRVTPNSQKRIAKQFVQTPWRTFLLKTFPLGQRKRDWVSVRRVAFQKSLLWKLSHVPPRSLWCSQVTLKQAGEIQASFFDYCGEAVSAYDSHFKALMNSQTETQPGKSEA